MAVDDNYREVIRKAGIEIGQGNTEYSLRVTQSTQNPSGDFDEFAVPGLDLQNSTSTPLSAGASYVGAWVNVEKYSTLGVIVYSSHVSATLGLEVHYSTDGVNVDESDNFTIPAADGKLYTFPLIAKYYRIKYTNSGSTQTAFRMQSKLFVQSPKPSTHRIDDQVIAEDDVELVKSAITGKDINGIYRNVNTSTLGDLFVVESLRPSQIKGRQFVEGKIQRVTMTGSGTTIYPSGSFGGKTLYMESFEASFINTSNAVGEWRLRDGTSEKMSFLITEKSTGAPAVLSTQSPFLPEPIPFTTSVNAIQISGSIQLSFWFLGYLE